MHSAIEGHDHRIHHTSVPMRDIPSGIDYIVNEDSLDNVFGSRNYHESFDTKNIQNQ